MIYAVEWLRAHIEDGRTVARVLVIPEYHDAILASGLVASSVLKPATTRPECIIVVDKSGTEWAAVLCS